MSRQPINQAIISQLINDLRNGQLRRSLDMGFTEEDIRLLQDPERVSLLLDTPVRWSIVKVDSAIMRRLFNRVHDTEKEIAIIDEMLKLGASSQMIADVFGFNQREVAFRKRVLEIDKKQGRWQEVTEAQNHELWHKWKAKIEQYQLDQDNLVDMAKVCMILAKTSDIPMAMIWGAMKKWMEEEQVLVSEEVRDPLVAQESEEFDA